MDEPIFDDLNHQNEPSYQRCYTLMAFIKCEHLIRQLLSVASDARHRIYSS